VFLLVGFRYLCLVARHQIMCSMYHYYL
jgi:hypothetical protein